MTAFKYYKRGAGELDTSNFPDIVNSGSVCVHKLDDKTYVALWALNTYLDSIEGYKRVRVFVTGYVAHMRGDKDEFSVGTLLNQLRNLNFSVRSIQHESEHPIHSGFVTRDDIARDLKLKGSSFFIGADASVPKFCPDIDLCASKVRESGKVISSKTDISSIPEDCDNIVIADDILGGGATIQMVVDEIKADRKPKKLCLWIAYHEGIHKEEFLKQFDAVYIGEEV